MADGNPSAIYPVNISSRQAGMALIDRGQRCNHVLLDLLTPMLFPDPSNTRLQGFHPFQGICLPAQQDHVPFFLD